MDPDANVAELTIDEAVDAAMRHAIDSMFVDGRQPDLFDDYRLRSVTFAPMLDHHIHYAADQSSSDGDESA